MTSLFQAFVSLAHFIGRLPQLPGDLFLIRGHPIGPFAEFRPMLLVMFQPVGQQAIQLVRSVVHKILVFARFQNDGEENIRK
jgi:hypothetical protein